MKHTLAILSLLFLLLSCSSNTSPDEDYDSVLRMISETDIKSAIDLTNQWRTSKPEITSYINTEELVVIFPDERKVTIPQPENEMYVAVAPYINETHSCATHYISSCQAELKKKSFLITAGSGNEQILSKTVQSLNNGFIEIWLPRKKEITLKIKYDGKVVEESISTYEGDRTCITTMRLK